MFTCFGIRFGSTNFIADKMINHCSNLVQFFSTINKETTLRRKYLYVIYDPNHDQPYRYLRRDSFWLACVSSNVNQNRTHTHTHTYTHSHTHNTARRICGHLSEKWCYLAAPNGPSNQFKCEFIAAALWSFRNMYSIYVFKLALHGKRKACALLCLTVRRLIRIVLQSTDHDEAYQKAVAERETRHEQSRGQLMRTGDDLMVLWPPKQ